MIRVDVPEAGECLLRDCRRHERAQSRNLMQSARSRQVDWDDFTVSYKRPDFW